MDGCLGLGDGGQRRRVGADLSLSSLSTASWGGLTMARWSVIFLSGWCTVSGAIGRAETVVPFFFYAPGERSKVLVRG